MRKIIHRLILWYYRREFREITKVTKEEELDLYMLKNNEKMLHVIRSEITKYVLKEFESKSPDEKLMYKGATIALGLMRDCHLMAIKIKSETKNPDDQLKMWSKFKAKIG